MLAAASEGKRQMTPSAILKMSTYPSTMAGYPPQWRALQVLLTCLLCLTLPAGSRLRLPQTRILVPVG